MYEVIVGNVGTVYQGDDRRIARNTYAEYVELSVSAYIQHSDVRDTPFSGRALGEDVTLMHNGEIIDEFTGEGYKDDEDARCNVLVTKTLHCHKTAGHTGDHT